MKEKLLQIFNTKKISVESRQYVLDCCKKIGVDFTPANRCVECYRDAVAICLRKIAEQEAIDDEKKYILKPNVDIIYKGIRVTTENLTDDVAMQMCKGGLARLFIKKP